MKPTNSVYVGGPPLDPPEDVVMINCTYCHRSSYAIQWRKNDGDCPRCGKPYAGHPNED